jgi:hypothetical protein
MDYTKDYTIQQIILSNTVNFLNNYQIKTMRVVCKIWKKIINEIGLNVITLEIQKLLSDNNHEFIINELSIKKNMYLDNIIIGKLVRLINQRRVKKLIIDPNFSNDEYTSIDKAIEMGIIVPNKSLKILKMGYSAFSGFRIPLIVLAQIFPNLEKIQTHFYNIPQVCVVEDTFKIEMDNMIKMRKLKNLEVGLSESFYEHFIKQLKFMPNLNKLKLFVDLYSFTKYQLEKNNFNLAEYNTLEKLSLILKKQTMQIGKISMKPDKGNTLSSIAMQLIENPQQPNKFILNLNTMKKIKLLKISKIESVLMEVKGCIDTMIISDVHYLNLISKNDDSSDSITNLYYNSKNNTGSNTITIDVSRLQINNIKLEICCYHDISTTTLILLKSHLTHFILHVFYFECHCICERSTCSNPIGCYKVLRKIEAVLGDLSNYKKLRSVRIIFKYSTQSIEVDFKTQISNRSIKML